MLNYQVVPEVERIINYSRFLNKLLTLTFSRLLQISLFHNLAHCGMACPSSETAGEERVKLQRWEVESKCMRGTWIDMSKEERESAGLQEGPAQVPRIERHTWGLQSYISYYMIIIILYCAHYPKLNDTCHMHTWGLSILCSTV